MTAHPQLAAIGRAVAALTAGDGAGGPAGDDAPGPPTPGAGHGDEHGDEHGGGRGAVAIATAAGAMGLSEADVLAGVRLASRLVRVLAGVDLAGGPSSVLLELPVAVEDLRRSVDAVHARAACAAQTDAAWRLDGQRSFTSWMEATTGAPRSKVTRETARAQRLRDYLPTFTTLLRAGRVSGEHIDALVRYGMSSEPRIQALTDPEVGEVFLAQAAAGVTVAQFTTIVRSWAAHADPHAEERTWRERLATEYLTLSPTMGGWHLDGLFNDEHGQMLRIALNAQTGQVSSRDERSRGQRDANALSDLVKMILDSGTVQSSARIRPHLIAIVPIQTLTSTTTASALAGGGWPNTPRPWPLAPRASPRNPKRS